VGSRFNVLAGAVCVGLSAGARAAPFYEAFDYASGTALSGNMNQSTGSPLTWNYVGPGTANTADPTIGSGGLEYPGFAASAGNSGLADGSQGGVWRINLPGGVNSGTVYYSVLGGVSDLTGLTNTTTGSFLGGLNSGVGPGTSVTTAGAGLMIHRDAVDANAYNLGVGATVTNADRIFETTPRTAGQTLLVVGAYQFNEGADNDIAYLWINPDPGTFGAESAPGANVTSNAATVAGGTDNAQLASFFLRNNGVEPQQMQIDEVRVGASWAEVTAVPEPAGLLAAVGAIGLVVRRKGRIMIRA